MWITGCLGGFVYSANGALRSPPSTLNTFLHSSRKKEGLIKKKRGRNTTVLWMLFRSKYKKIKNKQNFFWLSNMAKPVPFSLHFAHFLPSLSIPSFCNGRVRDWTVHWIFPPSKSRSTTVFQTCVTSRSCDFRYCIKTSLRNTLSKTESGFSALLALVFYSLWRGNVRALRDTHCAQTTIAEELFFPFSLSKSFHMNVNVFSSTCTLP